MKNIYLIILLLFFKAGYNQNIQPFTIREAFDFGVGDTFIYQRMVWDGIPPVCEQTTETVISKRYSTWADSVIYEFKVDRYDGLPYCTGRPNPIFPFNTYISETCYTHLDSSIFYYWNDWQSMCNPQDPYCSDTIIQNTDYNGRTYVKVKFNLFNSLSETVVKGIGQAQQDSYREGNKTTYNNKLVYFHKVNEQPWSNGTAIINSIPDLPFQKISLYPTLVHQQFTVNLQGEVAAKEASLVLYDGLGQPVINKVLTEDKTLLDSGGLGKGFYTWAIMYEGHQVKNGKLIIQ